VPKPIRLLAVDDDPVILNLLKVNFELDGFDVLTAADGQEALDTAQAEKPDVVLLDIMMPKLSGLEVTKALKADTATKGIPIMLLSAKAQEADVDAGMKIGADAYVTKPFDPIDLVQRVHDLVRSHRRSH
jgi:DNA-binding response OmpR family regulator